MLNHRLPALIVWFNLALISARSSADDVLNVLHDLRPPIRMLHDYLRPLVHEALDVRLAGLEELTTSEKIRDYQRRMQVAFLDSLGGFPDRTPLNATVVGHVRGDGYRIEKVIYESRPGFHVTAVVYLPESAPPFPGVLIPCGHSENGKAAYQQIGILLARNGMAAMCYDPIGQGERKQILSKDTSGQPTSKGQFRATLEHSLAGVTPILLGQSLATYRIWDGIRSIDYLASRDDIDPTRIGCTGNSGGGLMTSYLMALDHRIVAAAPSCFITTTRLKNDSPGPGDAEQNIFGQIAYGLDHADYMMIRAPKPTLICSATRDFVPIDGTWEAFRQTKRLYTRLGFSERIGLVEADATHGFSLHLRVGAARWMSRWLLQDDHALSESKTAEHPDADLQCTPDGQVLLLKGARSVFDVYRDVASDLKPTRHEGLRHLDRKARISMVRETAGIRALSDLRKPKVTLIGEVLRSGYKIEKLRLEPEGHVVLPALLFVPEDAGGKAALYLNQLGKHADAQPGGRIEQLVREGYRVLAVDLRGYGETATTPWRLPSDYFGPNGAEFFIAYMLGRSLVGMRAEDVLVCARYLSELTGENRPVDVFAIGSVAVPVLHAAAVRPELFASVHLRHTIDSWQHVLDAPVTRGQLENCIHGVLRRYDLTDLVNLVGPDRITITNRTDAMGVTMATGR